MEETAQVLYAEIFKIARHFLNQTELHDIHTLNEHNDPTYDEIAKSARALSIIMETIAAHCGYDQQRIAINAKQAALFMSRIALAINEKNEDELKEAQKELAAMAFI